ncbi:DNA-directed RNA polymerases I and III subunit RPAC2 [Monosporozyma servazzii]
MSDITDKKQEQDVAMEGGEATAGVAAEQAVVAQSEEDNDNDNDDDDDEEELDKEKIKILPQATSEDGTSASFQIANEDHTLGNVLRYIIMKNPEVEFCGYSIPHPSEDFLNIRIQTYGDITAVDALKKGLQDMMDMCDAVEEKFTQRIREM